MSRNNGCSDALLLFLSIPLLFVASVFASGYALSVLWGWFVVPTFDAPPLSVPVAFGLSMIVGFMTYQETKSESENDKSAVEIIFITMVKVIIRPAMALLFGWIVFRFFM